MYHIDLNHLGALTVGNLDILQEIAGHRSEQGLLVHLMAQEDPGQDQEMVPVHTHQEVEVVAVALEVTEVAAHLEEVTTVEASVVEAEAAGAVDTKTCAEGAEAARVLGVAEISHEHT